MRKHGAGHSFRFKLSCSRWLYAPVSELKLSFPFMKTIRTGAPPPVLIV